MTAEVTYEGGLRCRTACGPARTALWTDVPAVYGGRGEHPGPMDLLQAALGTCIMGVVGIVAERCGVDAVGARALVCREMDATGRRIARLAVTVEMPGAAPAEVRAAIESAARACPVHSVLDPDLDAPIAFRWGGE